MKQTLLFIAGLFLSAGSFGQATDLFFSEYIEGSSNNKYLEIYNGTGNSVDLSDYQVLVFSNGKAEDQPPSYSETLSGMLNNNAVFVIANSSATTYPGTVNLESTVTYFNGDDAVALKKISTSSYVDIIGRIGEDPGSYWSDGSITTVNSTLVRKASVISGITVNPTEGFPTLASEWNVFAIDDVSNLGSHSVSTTVGTIALTAPNGGETYDAGDLVSITWTSSDVTTINIEVLNNDSEWHLIATNILATNGTLDFTIPDNAWYWDGYKLRISDADNASVSDESDATFTIIGHDKEVFYHEFDDSTFGSFITSSQLGDQVWDAAHGSYARINGYSSGSAQDNEDWLVSPAINLDNSINEILEFNAYYNYSGPDLQLFYTPVFSGDPSLSNWTELNFNKPSSSATWQYVLVDISDLLGNAYFGFKYTSTTDGAAEWRVNEIYISGVNYEPTNIHNPTANLTVAPNPFENQITIIANGIVRVEVINTIGQTVLQTKGNNLDKMVIPTSKLDKGVYIVKITDTKGKVQTKKVIKK